MDVAKFAYACQSSWMPRTWYLMRASLLFYFEAIATVDAMTAAQYLVTRSAHSCAEKSTKTSARRRKNFHEDDLKPIVEIIRESRSQYAPLLELWILFGRMTGLRPHEWCKADVLEEMPETGEKGPFLRVRNAKATNGRGNGKYRHLDLSAIPPSTTEALRMFAKHMDTLALRGEYERTYHAVRNLLRQANRKVYGGRRQQYISLYSVRHLFSSAAKAAMTLVEVAALMGHNNNRTASLHYGRRRHASGGLDVKPRSEEVATVREVRREWYPATNDVTAGLVDGPSKT